MRAKQLHFAPNNFIFAPKNIIFCAKFKFTPAPEEKILLGVKPKVAPEEKNLLGIKPKVAPEISRKSGVKRKLDSDTKWMNLLDA